MMVGLFFWEIATYFFWAPFFPESFVWYMKLECIGGVLVYTGYLLILMYLMINDDKFMEVDDAVVMSLLIYFCVVMIFVYLIGAFAKK